jgi:hypothetical protein
MFDSETQFDRDVKSAVAATEREIFYEAAAGEEPDEGMKEFVDEMSQSEGWDGDPLPIEEIAHRALNGDDENNFDRPMLLEDEHELAQENAQLRQQLAQREQEYELMLGQPMAEAQRAQMRENARTQLENAYGLVSLNDEQLDRFLGDMYTAKAHGENLEAARFNASMAYAHNQHGQDFERAYDSLTSMNPRNPLARQIVEHVRNSADPGAALMGLADNSLVTALGSGRTAPFLPRPSMPRAHPRSRRDEPSFERLAEANENMSWSRDMERDILNSAFD